MFVSLNLVPFALVIFHSLIFHSIVIFHCFSPTKEVPVLSNCFIISLPGMNRPGLVIVFVVVLNTLGAHELAELLGQLRTSAVNSKRVV